MAVWNGKLIGSVAAAAPEDPDDWVPEGAVAASDDDWVPEGAKPARVTKQKVSRGSASPPDGLVEKAMDVLGVRDEGAARAGVLGFSQGGTAGFADELAAGIVNLRDRLRGGGAIKAGANAPPELRAQIDAKGGSLGDKLKARMRAELEQAREDHPETYIPGEIAGMLGSGVVGGAAVGAASKLAAPVARGVGALSTLAKAKPLAAAIAGGAAQGGLYGAGSSNADSAAGVALDTLVGMGLGAGGGALGHAVGAGAKAATGGLRRLASGRAAKATEQIGELAKAAADEQTKSARSAAGRAAQDAYRQMEHLRDLGHQGRLTPEQQKVFLELTEELGGKAQEKLLPAAADKASSTAAYKDVLESESARVAEAAKRIGNPMNQLKPRLKRYALPLAGGLAGMLLGEGNPLSAGAGLLAGRGISPTVQALARMAKHPSVQRSIWNALESASGGAERAGAAVSRVAAPAARSAQVEMDDALIQALADALGADGEERVAGR